jgi:hypothetical protein
MSERRYNEDEVAAIFERAAETQQVTRRQAGSRPGMTLSELQEIGREVGIAPEAVASAARSLEVASPAPVRRFLGVPIGVARTVELERRLSEEEWERLVIDLRETLDARGKVTTEGSFRQWTNGNLQALLEPTSTGHRLRLRTFKGSASGLMTSGLAVFGVSLVTWVATALNGGIGGQFWQDIGMLSTIGIGLFGAGALQLPGWARLRRRQMEDIAKRLMHAVSSAPPARSPSDDPSV